MTGILSGRLGFVTVLILATAGCMPSDSVTAIAEIEKLGGKLTIDNADPSNPVISAELVNATVTDEQLRHLRGLPQLKTLDLGGTKVSNAGLENLNWLPQLQSLSLPRHGKYQACAIWPVPGGGSTSGVRRLSHVRSSLDQPR